ncbi:MAG: long-chain-acyl-CoA synthetase [Terracidiphilus sp.]
MMTIEKSDVALAGISPAKAWLRALEMTAPITRNRHRTLHTVVEEVAARRGDAPALLSDRESMTYSALVQRANKYARWALEQGLAKGDVVCLLMTNRPEYFAVWLGITSVGAVVSLLNTNLVGSALAHCIRIVSPKQIIASAEFVDALTDVMPQLEISPAIWTHGHGNAPFARVIERDIQREMERYSGEPLSSSERRPPAIDDLALYIYTSGTTGLPKAAKVSHVRAMQWSYWFAGMMNVQPMDRIYNCLPMYHSVGGVQAIGAMLVAGGSAVVRERFSARQFWDDVVRWDCTLFQYIGELCRYLLHADFSTNETRHRIRLACGNGLAAEIWDAFKDRFRIPQILEFYAATEGNVSLFNIRGKRGAIGHIPPYLSHRFSPLVVVANIETSEPARNELGFCISCAPNQVGEALGKIVDDTSNSGSSFEGYTSTEESEKKILRDVLEPGDRWFRTGDLMRKDEKGYYYFVDRLGDTFRRKGENVATSEVAEIICGFTGVQHANVYGVAVPGVEGRVGMATLATDAELDLAGFREHLTGRLPSYARPAFLRIRSQVELTGTFKYSKTELVREGYDPDACSDLLYFDNGHEFIPLDRELYERIQGGEYRL